MKKMFTLSLFVIVLLSCASKQTVEKTDASDEFERAYSLFENKKFTQAIEAFERILFYHPTSEYVDDAQYLLGRTYFEIKDYDQAIAEFDYLIRNFSTSKYLEEAFLFRAKSYLHKAPGYAKDPTQIENAIELFGQFLTKFPNSKYTDEVKADILTARNRLAKKELENGKLYNKLGYKNAALIYFNYITETYPETDVSAEAKYYAASIHEEKGELAAALELYNELLEEKDWQEKAQKKIKEIEKELNTNS